MSLLLAACLLSQLPGALELDPGLSWYTYETERFAVHFSSRGRPDEQAESLAAHVALLAEDAHDQLTSLTGWTPASRTQIVIADFFDYSNGWAAPLPDNTITIIPTLPAGDRTGFDNWLRTLLVHEYAHIIQMDMARGLPGFLRRIFGRAALPNALAPVWLLEGYALHAEARAVGYGRARSAQYDMMIRAAADAGKLLTIDRCANYELMRWPRGNAPYLYGGLFMRHLAANDPSAWDRYSLTRAAGTPYFDNLFARRVFGHTFDRLWHDWQTAVTRHADSVRTELERDGLTAVSAVTRDELAASAPLWSRSGAEIYYVSRSGREYPSIKAVNPVTGVSRILHEGRITGNLSLSPDGRLLAFGQFVLSRTSDLSDIFSLNLQTGELERLTHNMRARDPDFSPDSASLVFVSSNHGRNDLISRNLATGECENLTESEDLVGYSSPRFSPDGRFLAVAANRTGAGANIEVMDLKTGWTIPVTEDLANSISPSWSRTGKHIFFASDRTGVYNLFAWSQESEQLKQCTNVLYGVFQPSVSPDNRRIALLSHSARGDDVGFIPLDARDWRPAPAFTDTLRALPSQELPTSEFSLLTSGLSGRRALSPLYHYNPFPTLLPKMWLPLAWYDGTWYLGAFTLGWDALQFHRYTAVAGWRTGRGPFGLLGYEYRRVLPITELNVSADTARQDAALRLSIPFIADRRSSSLALTGRLRRDTAISSGYSLAFATSNARGYRFNSSPVEGTLSGLSTDLSLKPVLGTRNRGRALGYFAGFLGARPESDDLSPLSRWSLSLRAAAGTGFGDASRDSSWLIPSDNSIIGVRGPTVESRHGRNILAASVRLHAPLAWPERGISTAPLFVRNLNACLFADAALAWNRWLPENAEWKRLRTGIGTELRADLILGHLLPASLTLGYARGILPQSGNQLYVRLESSLLIELLNRPDLDRLDPTFLRN